MSCLEQTNHFSEIKFSKNALFECKESFLFTLRSKKKFDWALHLYYWSQDIEMFFNSQNLWSIVISQPIS